jgi:hypothetical protein
MTVQSSDGEGMRDSGAIVVLDLVDRVRSGALETLARLVAEPGRPVTPIHVHPDGVNVLRSLVERRLGRGSFGQGLVRGAAFLDRVVEVVRTSGTEEAVGPYRVGSIDALPNLRLRTDGDQYDASARDAAARAAVAEPRAREAYAATLPIVHLARCPFTGDLVSVPLDDVGLDGPYWDFQDPVHPPFGDVPATFLGSAGAMRIDEARLESTPYVCVPGPDVPVVVPQLLMHPAVRAVLTAVWIGPHTGFVTTYFAEPGAEVPHPWVARWGAKDYVVPSGARRGEVLTPMPPLLDAELTPWIATGKLAWVEPKDASLTARSGVDDCPWLGIPGTTTLQAVQDGHRLS